MEIYLKSKGKEKGKEVLYTFSFKRLYLRKKLKEYKLCTEKYEQDESSTPNSENEDKMGNGDKCESSSKTEEKEVFGGFAVLVKKGKRRNISMAKLISAYPMLSTSSFSCLIVMPGSILMTMLFMSLLNFQYSRHVALAASLACMLSITEF
jgi:hypothetical protein